MVCHRWAQLWPCCELALAVGFIRQAEIRFIGSGRGCTHWRCYGYGGEAQAFGLIGGPLSGDLTHKLRLFAEGSSNVVLKAGCYDKGGMIQQRLTIIGYRFIGRRRWKWLKVFLLFKVVGLSARQCEL